jgi:methyl-accepting chemotaxis protein
MSNGRHQLDLLDRALRDLSPEQRARALDLTLRLGVEHDDPLWLICLAIGQLQVLIEDAPTNWKETFASFSNDLEAWTTTNLKVLETITHQAEAAADLAEVSKKLTDTLNELTKLLSEQNTQHLSLRQDIRNLQKRLDSLKGAVTEQTTSIMGSLGTLISGENTRNTLINSLSRKVLNIRPVMIGLVLLTVLNGAGVFLLWFGLQKNNQQLTWLLQKATRMECKQGIIPKSRLECQGVGK